MHLPSHDPLAGFDLIDAHLHLWDPAAGHPWLRGELRRAFTLEDLRAEVDQSELAVDPCRAVGFILVEAARDGGTGEARQLLALVSEHPFLLGVVASLPDQGATGLSEDLLQDRGLLGVCTSSDQIQRHSPSELAELATLLAHHELTWELNLPPDELPRVAQALDLADAHPTVVADHLAGHPSGELSGAWLDAIRALVERTRVVAKVSGLLTRSRQMSVDQIEQVTAHLAQLLGPEQLIVGSDWPVCTQVDGWSTSIDCAQRLLQRVAPGTDPCAAVYRAYPRLQGSLLRG